MKPERRFFLYKSTTQEPMSAIFEYLPDRRINKGGKLGLMKAIQSSIIESKTGNVFCDHIRTSVQEIFSQQADDTKVTEIDINDYPEMLL